MRILVCDGDAGRRARLVEAVLSAGGEPLEFERADEATRAAGAVELALLGGAEGWAALALLSRSHPALPRITVAGAVDDEELARVADAVRASLGAHRPAPRDFEALTRDRLTGVLGWHYFRLKLDEELGRAQRYTRALSLVFMDVDDLRGLNDRLGRGAGDFALAQVAQAIVTGARAVDCVGRWSGGGFALLLPETAVGAAYGLAERLRADLAARRLPAPPQLLHPSRPLRVTVSCGVASLYKDGAPRPNTLLQRADKALWRAKVGGRNRSMVE